MTDEISDHETAVPPAGVAAVFRSEGQFIWRTLGRLGVREPDLEDVTQEVLVVVHRRLSKYDANAPLRSWLYGICRRVAAGYHRRAHRRRERLVESPPDGGSTSGSPESNAMLREARDRLERVLSQLSADQRVVFVMFEIEGLGCAEIAATLGVPIGTVHSRLHAARATFQKLVRRLAVTEGALVEGES